LLLVLFSVVGCGTAAELRVQTNPLSKVLELMDDLTAKIVKEGESEEKAFQDYTHWCTDMAKNSGFQIKTAESRKEKLEAKISELTSSITVYVSNIEELVAAIAADEAELKNATAIRHKEHDEFSANEDELMDCVETLERSVSVISKEMQKNPAALAQLDTSSTARLVQTMGAVIDAAGFVGIDKKKLVAMVQSQNSENDDAEVGAPAAAVYKSHSSGLMDVLEDMKEKAEASLSDLRNEEKNSQYNYELLKQSLEEQMAADGKDMDDAKAAKAEASESKATADGDLEETVKMLTNTKDNLGTLSSSCMQTASDHDATIKARTEELKAIATAKNTLVETASGAGEQSYSFLQFSRLQSGADIAGLEVVQLVKQLAKKQRSAALSQLASRMSAAIRFGSVGGGDPFAKVKSLIENMIAKLEKEAEEEATEKAYCDEEMTKTGMKHGELMDDISKLSAKLDQATSKSLMLSADIKQLEAELAALMKSQAEMDKIRQEENSAFTQAQSDLKAGLEGVREALGILRDYYASDDAFVQQGAMVGHVKASSAASSIIALLEVVESDFATGLAKEESQEADAQETYSDTTMENKVSKTMKEQDLKYKTKEVKSLKKAIADLSSDKDAMDSELSAVNEYYSKLKDRCVAKPETYEVRKARRESEIKGLKTGLNILESETAFLQRKRWHGHIRGSLEVR